MKTALRFLRPLIVVSTFMPLTHCVAIRTSTPEDDSSGTSGRSAKDSVVVALKQFDGSTDVQPKVAAAELKGYKEKTDGPERAVISDVLPLVEKRAKDPASITRADYEKVMQAMARMADAHPKDFELQLAMASGIFNIEQSLGAMSGQVGGVEGDTAAQAGRQRAEALVLNFPTEARAHAQLGQVLAARGNDPVQAMRSYLRCYEIDKTQRACQNAFKSLAEEYAKPRCTEFKPDRFAAHAAYEKPKAGLKRVSFDGKPLFQEKAPALTGTNINDAYESTAAENQGIGKGLTIWLTPTAAARFAELTQTLADQQGYLTIYVGGKLVGAPRIASAIETGQIQVEGKHLKVTQLCAKAQGKRLPEDLAKGLK